MIERAPRGQSFIEAMIAITIIVTAVSSALALVQASITATHNGGIQVVAANLAREGLETVRSLRDTNWLKSQTFQLGLVDASGSMKKDARPLLNLGTGAWSLSFATIPADLSNAAVYVTGEGVYVQADSQPSGSAASPYTRLLTLQHICRDNGTGVERIVGGASTCAGTETLVGLSVDSKVRWRGTGGNFQTLTVNERFYDWR
jgi:hypothetical protein